MREFYYRSAQLALGQFPGVERGLRSKICQV